MKKIENVYKEVLFQVLENQNNKMSQLELSKKLGISLSTVNFAIKKLEKINSIKINKMNFVVISPMRILYLWASDRNLEKDIIFKANINMSVREIERNLSNVIYAGYSSYKLKFNDIPADYSEVYVYADEKQLEEIKKRFKGFIKDSNNPNFFVLKKSNKDYGKLDTIAQIFVDFWNLKTWYAQDFLNALEEKIKDKIKEKIGVKNA